VERIGNRHLPFILFANRASVQESVRESPFYLLYGLDPRLLTVLDMDSNTLSREWM